MPFYSIRFYCGGYEGFGSDPNRTQNSMEYSKCPFLIRYIWVFWYLFGTTDIFLSSRFEFSGMVLSFGYNFRFIIWVIGFNHGQFQGLWVRFWILFGYLNILGYFQGFSGIYRFRIFLGFRVLNTRNRPETDPKLLGTKKQCVLSVPSQLDSNRLGPEITRTDKF